ncbi:adenine deaminase [bacterium]|nr:adenine deaminase [candidate division CSSED10-310 bacterium]
MGIRESIKAAKGQIAPDLILKGGRIVNVFSQEIYETDIAIKGQYIVGLGSYEGAEIISLDGAFVCPGLIDGHLHVESAMITIPEFTRAVLPRGTTALVIDPHEIANVMGLEGINYMLKSSKYNPMDVYIMLPSCVPATKMETAGADLRAIDLLPLLNNRWVLGLGEMMNYPGLLNCEDDVIEKLKICQDKIIDGHAPGLTGHDLCAYVCTGIRSDHECINEAEAREKMRLGMHIMMREGSSSKNLLDLLPLVNAGNSARFSFVSDDRNPRDLLHQGHMDHVIRLAVRHGIDPVTAIRMATINTAQYFKLSDLGAVAPGYRADLAIVDSLEEFQVRMVVKNGQVVVRNGEMLVEPTHRAPIKIRGSVNIKWLSENDFRIPARGRHCRVIQMIPNQINTRAVILAPPISDGYVTADPAADLLKLAVVERHMASTTVSMGLLKGLGLRSGAIATTVSHDSHNMVVAGTNENDMFKAAVQLAKLQGGITYVENGTVIESLPLPIAGLISDQPLEFVVDKLSMLIEAVRTRGVHADDPFMALSFLALPVIPSLKLTDQGLIDVETFTPVDLFVD